ncbi:UDP-N-acetylmuramoyl-L-alanine--D-glutamate ligase [bacterium]|nr:UDP-N-acetylmuramoyl-L-alanine--D-glutamate ligase [bacterium]MBU1752301.1 UDP-N-acetylmuramoyl-L-alanine--D-glutamate ligase [bacterium]
MIDIKEKLVTVVGLGRSGLAAAKLLHKIGAKVRATDAKPMDNLDNGIEELRLSGVEIETGKNTPQFFKGSQLIVLSPGIPGNIPVLSKSIADSVPIISELELGWQCLQGQRVVGITGTNGKTTTTTLIGEMLKAAGMNPFVGGNIGTPLCEKVLELKNVPVILEISSFQLEEIDEFRADIAVFLNLTPDHLDRYKDMNEYTRAKARIFDNQMPSDFSVLNADYDTVLSLARHGEAEQIYFSRQKRLNHSGVYLESGKIIANIYGQKLSICKYEDVRIPGPYNLENAMAATAVAMLLKIPTEIIAKTLREFKGVEHRMELTEVIKGIRFINDSKATNVDSVICALNSFSAPIVLIAGGKDKGCDYGRLTPLLNEKVRAVVLLGEAAERIEKESGFKPSYRTSSLEEAILTAYQAASVGDTVLFSPACSSFDMFKNYEERGRIFKEIVRNLKSEVSEMSDRSDRSDRSD